MKHSVREFIRRRQSQWDREGEGEKNEVSRSVEREKTLKIHFPAARMRRRSEILEGGGEENMVRIENSRARRKFPSLLFLARKSPLPSLADDRLTTYLPGLLSSSAAIYTFSPSPLPSSLLLLRPLRSETEIFTL